MKFSVKPYAITKSYAETLRRKLTAFREKTATQKTLLLTLVTTFGVSPNAYSMQLVQDVLTMDALFA